MSADNINEQEQEEQEEAVQSTGSKDHERFAKLTGIDESKKFRLTGMYKDWFLDYASYVILERAVPHLNDGLKPVQRRILHAMKRIDDGRFNKVANIIGHTMQYHPHGDASIGDALVQLGQKDLLVETQGNWGNIFTGDSAAAPRYIEARLSRFALDIAFNGKTTEWMASYDGRNQEPVTLPVKFPLLLAQGVEGIAVGLASKILPHNFNELIEAAIAHLNGKSFEIFPDFPTGGLADASRYNDGLRGGAVKVRARIAKRDSKTLAIVDIPFGKTSTTLIESILKANERGKIKVRKVDDNTAADVEILVHLHNDVSADKTIDALYAFTDCEISISPNACVIVDDKPVFVGVSEILRHNVEHTKRLLQQELQIRMDELEEDWHYSSLEKIFFEQRIYKELEKDSATWEAQLKAIEASLNRFRKLLKRDISPDDVIRLCEKPVRKISKFDIKAADEHIKAVDAEMAEVKNHLANLVSYTIAYFKQIQKKYGKGRDRKTQLGSFEAIEATQVAVANAKLYVNKNEGFVGMDLRRDDLAEFVSECSDIDDVIVFLKNGKYVVSKVSDKSFFGKDILHVGVFKKNDMRTVYNVAYRDGRAGSIMYKRFSVTGVIRDKEYDMTKGEEGSEVLWFSANRNGEAEKLRIYLKPRPRLRNLVLDLDFSQIDVKGRQSQGNIFTRFAIHKIQLKEKGVSTLGGQKTWFDPANKRLNTEERGIWLGEFFEGDKLLAITKSGMFYTTNFDLVNHYDEDLGYIKKFDPHQIFSAVYFDADQKMYYIKRFTLETSINPQSFIDEDNKDSFLVALSIDEFPQVEVAFGGKHAKRAPEYIDVESFIAVKSFRAKGKRLTTFEVKKIQFVEPLARSVAPEPEDSSSSSEESSDFDEDISTDNVSGSKAVQGDLF
ncbi:MAG: DNA gyrase/topoisomerase IV subunit A [Prevotellaceae bacterium]|jgi:topoisomerase-4 subunit A|nr:DNA gyrase/topoisomerase IV subunit A [Prevotellaceae bacterium]